MQIVEALGDARVTDATGRPAYALHAGRRYVLYDHEACFGLRADALQVVGTLDRQLPPYEGQPLAHQRLLLPFIGRMGDAIVTASCLEALARQHPHVIVDVACRPTAREVFELAPPTGKLLDYPVSAHRLDVYDYHLSFEDIESVREGTSDGLFRLFSSCLGTPMPDSPCEIRLPTSTRDRWRPACSDAARAGVHPGRRGSLRSYPGERTCELIRLLNRDGFDVFLLGHDEFDEEPWRDLSGVYDLRGCTATVGDLASIISHMDVLFTSDSFPAHLGGSLGKPTVLALTTTTPLVARDYPTVRTLTSEAECSPCHALDGGCPLGHARCVAGLDPALAPEKVAAAMRDAIEFEVPVM